MENSITKWSPKILVVAIVSTTIVLLLLAFTGTSRGVLIYLLGRSGSCPFSATIGSQGTKDNQTKRFNKIRDLSVRLDRSEDGLELWNTPMGRYWIPAGTNSGLFYTLAEQERRVYSREPCGIRPGDVVLDCGANVGTYTRQALDAGAKIVVAIEPIPANVECLRRNFRQEIAADKVIIYPKGVWNETTQLTAWLHRNSVLDSFVMKNRPEEGGNNGKIVLPVTTIDFVIEDLNLERVDFIKMDIEGAEEQALTGAIKTLPRFRPRLAIATENLPSDQYRIPETVRRAWGGYRKLFGTCMPTDDFSVRPEVMFFY